MGGSVISHHQQQRIDHDLEAFKQGLRHKKKKKEQNNQRNKPNTIHQENKQRIILSYTHLLNRAYSKLHPNQNANDKQMSAPIVQLLPKICKELHRSPNHLKTFYESELVTNCN